MPLRNRKSVDALGQPIDSSSLYRPVQSFAGVLDGAPMVYRLDTRLLGSHPGVTQAPTMWIPAATDDATADRLHNAAIWGQPAPTHERLTHEPKPIPTDRQMVVTRDFIAGAGTSLVKLVAGDVIDREADYFADLVKAHPENFRPADAAA